MGATTTRSPVAAATPAALTASTPRQGDLLDILNYPRPRERNRHSESQEAAEAVVS